MSDATRRRGVRIAYEVVRVGRSDRRAAAVRADRPLAPVEGPGPVPEPALTGSSRSTAAATAARTARPIPTPTASSASSRTSKRSSMPPTPGAAVLVGLCGDGVWPAIAFAAAAPRSRPRPRRLRGRRAAPLTAASVEARLRRSMTSCRPTRAGPRSTATTGVATTRASREFFFERDHLGAPFDQARSRTRSSGRSTARSTR